MFNGPVIEVLKGALAEHLFEFRRIFPRKEVKEFQTQKLPRYISNGLSYSNKKHFTVISTRDMSYDEIIFEISEEPLHWAAIEAVKASPSGYSGDEIHILTQDRLHYKDLKTLVVEAEQVLKDLGDDLVCGLCEGAESDVLKRNIEKLLSKAFIFGKKANLNFDQKDMWSNISNWSLNTTTLGCSLIKLPSKHNYPDDYILLLKDINFEIVDLRQSLEQCKKNDTERSAKCINPINSAFNYYSLDIALLKYASINQKGKLAMLQKDIRDDLKVESNVVVANERLPRFVFLTLVFKRRLRYLQFAKPEHRHRSWFTGAYHITSQINNKHYESFSTRKLTKLELKELVRMNPQTKGFAANCIIPTFKNIWHQNSEIHASHRWPVTIVSLPSFSTGEIINSLKDIKNYTKHGYCKCCLAKMEVENSIITKGAHNHFALGCKDAQRNFLYLNHAHEGAKGYSEINDYSWTRDDYLSKLQDQDGFNEHSYFAESKRRITIMKIGDEPGSPYTSTDMITIIRDESLSEVDVLKDLLRLPSSSWNRSECFMTPNGFAPPEAQKFLKEANTNTQYVQRPLLTSKASNVNR